MDREPTISRRDLLRGRLFRGGGPGRDADAAGAGGAGHAPAPSGIGRRATLPIHRPPGAIDEAGFLTGCTRCNACVEACPVDAIVLAPPRFQRAAGTPMIDPHTNPCVMCADTPCITACEPRVLRPDQPLKMGVAWIETMACLAYTGSFCTVCAERCPVEGAIQVTQGRPVISAERCTGCGICHGVCPAPTNAIAIMPLFDRPPPTSAAS